MQTTLVEVDAGKLRRLIERFRARQSLLMGILGGLGAALFGAFIWGFLIGLTGLQYELAWVPMVGIGFLVGTMVRLCGKGIDRRFAVAGAVLALVAGLTGGFLSYCISLGWQLRLGNFSPLSIDWATTWRLCWAYVGWIDFALLAFTVWEAYHLSRYRLKDTQLATRAARRVALMFRPAKSLLCVHGHRWNPFRHWTWPGAGATLDCPRCGAVLQAAIPVDRPRAERWAEKKLLLIVLPVLFLSFPALVLLVWLAVSRWSVDELVVSPDGAILAVARRTTDGGATIQLWDLREERELARIGSVAQRVFGEGDKVSMPVFTPDSKSLVVIRRGSDEASRKRVSLVMKWDFAEKKEPGLLCRFPGLVRFMAVDGTGTTLVVVTADNQLHFVNLATGAERLVISHPGNMHALAMDPSGRTLATGTGDGQVLLWDLSSAQLQRTIPAHRYLVKGLAFSSTGDKLASVGGLDRSVKVWTAATGAEEASFALNMDWTTCVALAPRRQTPRRRRRLHSNVRSGAVMEHPRSSS